MKQWVIFVRSPDLREEHCVSSSAGEVQVNFKREVTDMMEHKFMTVHDCKDITFEHVNMPFFPDGGEERYRV